MKTKILDGKKFKLLFYEGYKGKETPRSVLIGSKELKIDSVLERKRVRDGRTGKTSEIFTCKLEGQHVRIVIHDGDLFELIYL